MDARKGGKEVVGLNSGVFNNTSFASFSNLQDLPFFESLASLGDFSSLAALQSFPSIPEHLFEEARAAVAAASQGSSSNLALGRNDSFSNLTQSSLHNLQLFLSEVEQGVNATNQSATPPPTTTPPSLTYQPQHRNHAQQAPQPLPAAATAASYTAQIPSPAARTALPPLKAGPAPTPIAPAPSYPSPAQFAAFSPSLGAFPQYSAQPQQWGPPPSRQPMQQGKLPVSAATSSPMMQSPGGPPAGVPPEFSNTLYSLASTLPPPMVLSNDSVLGSVGGGLHFQRHCVRRRMPDELGQDPSMFLN